jgi:2-C-methyl-D-erythritol 4-phosphate cytidylyltransferase
MITAIIPAAGIGLRMKKNIPKQYIKIYNKTILEWSLQNIIQNTDIKKIIVAINKNDTYFEKLNIIKNDKIKTCYGGMTRSQSVSNALNLESNSEYILVHDAVRPLLTLQDLKSLIRAAKESKTGAILAKPVTDTIKKVKNNNNIIKTIKRDNLWHALTPQMFPTILLKKALKTAQLQKKQLTDEASAIENLNLYVKCVEGQTDNIKITTMEDLEYVKNRLRH